MKFENLKNFISHGDGKYALSQFKNIGEHVVIEANVLVFHPENISIGSNVYIGHNTILKGYYKNEMVIQEGTWIGQGCFFHSAGGIRIGKSVGVGPYVKMLTSTHISDDLGQPVLHNPLVCKKVEIGNGADIGIASIIMPGVIVGDGAIIGAGSIVTKSVPENTVVAGNPARIIKMRKKPRT